jgi:hypothetical protein
VVIEIKGDRRRVIFFQRSHDREPGFAAPGRKLGMTSEDYG